MEGNPGIPPPPPMAFTQVSFEPSGAQYSPPPPPPTAITTYPNQDAIEFDMDSQQADEDHNSSIGSFILSSLSSAGSGKVKTSRSPRKTKDTNNDSVDTNNITEGGRTRQPRRSSRAIDDDRLYDGTQLHANHHGYFVHRDYASHFFRWGFAARQIKIGMRVLDVGSGQDLPLPRVISAPNVYPNCKPEVVTCVDWNPINRKFNPAWLNVIDEFDFNKRWPEIVGSFLQDGRWVEVHNSKFDLITCFEVIEHQDVNQGDELLFGLKSCLKPGGKIIISTPIFDGKAAANHIHEYTAMELWEKFQKHGLVVMQRFGTFASLDIIKPHLTPEHQQLVEQLSMWYGNDVISCFLAPLYPDFSRNNCWVIMRAEDIQQ